MTARPAPLWHVTLLVAGQSAPGPAVEASLRRLCALDPGNLGARYGDSSAEVQFWDEADDLEQVVGAALDWWRGCRGAREVPDWPPVGIEVLDLQHWRASGGRPAAPGTVTRLP